MWSHWCQFQCPARGGAGGAAAGIAAAIGAAGAAAAAHAGGGGAGAGVVIPPPSPPGAGAAGPPASSTIAPVAFFDVAAGPSSDCAGARERRLPKGPSGGALRGASSSVPVLRLLESCGPASLAASAVPAAGGGGGGGLGTPLEPEGAELAGPVGTGSRIVGGGVFEVVAKGSAPSGSDGTSTTPPPWPAGPPGSSSIAFSIASSTTSIALSSSRRVKHMRAMPTAAVATTGPNLAAASRAASSSRGVPTSWRITPTTF